MQAVAVLAPQLGREADVLLPLLLRRMEEFRVAEAGLSAVDAATAQEAIFARPRAPPRPQGPRPALPPAPARRPAAVRLRGE